MKVMTFIGARPQFVKSSVISSALNDRGVQEIIVHSGQHYDFNLSDIFFKELELKTPNYNLNVGSLSNLSQIAQMMIKLEEVILLENPSLLLVYGDTNTTLAGALVASKLLVPVFHIESGLRCYDRSVPEETNRVITDHLSTVLFCISKSSMVNLINEGVKNNVVFSGDVMFDVYLKYSPMVRFERVLGLLDENTLNYKQLKVLDYNLLTIHREENTRDAKSLSLLLDKINRSNFISIFPVHPRTKKLISEMQDTYSNIIFIDPVSYIDMLSLIKFCRKVITDSGGLLREAYFSKKQIITLRKSIEIQETLEFNINQLVHNDYSSLIEKIDSNLNIIDCSDGVGNMLSSEKIFGSIIINPSISVLIIFI
jgi:UDP-N-acetylglucosamine 2-epimerase